MNPQDTISAQDPLAQLQDIHLPPAIGLWPPAWGWWILLGLLLVAMGLAIYAWHKRKTRNAYRQLALHELQKIQHQFTDDERAEYLQAISILLRRTALSGFGNQFDPSLKGYPWLQWLDKQNPQTKYRFESEVGRALLLGPYQKHPAIDRQQLHKIVESWIVNHRNQWQQKITKKIPHQEPQSHV